MTTPLIEAIARAIDPLVFRSREKFIDYCLRDGDDQITAERYAQMTYGGNVEHAMFNAQAALTAITEAGYAVVPIEPTQAMLAAGIDVAEDVEDWTRDTNESYRIDCASDYPFPIYRAMISAAQGDGA